MKPFVPLLRFPMMSTQSLLDDVLPVHGQLFAENDHFLHIVLYKMCADHFLLSSNSSRVLFCIIQNIREKQRYYYSEHLFIQNNRYSIPAQMFK